MCFSQFYTNIYSSRLIRILQYLTIYMIITIMIRHAIDSLLNSSLSPTPDFYSIYHCTVTVCVWFYQFWFRLLVVVPGVVGNVWSAATGARLVWFPGVLSECCTLWSTAENLDGILHTSLYVYLCKKKTFVMCRIYTCTVMKNTNLILKNQIPHKYLHGFLSSCV